MLTELHKHLQETDLLPSASKLLVAVSGGADSVTMLHLLHNLRKYYDWEIAVAHYNHGLRADATRDAILVGDLAGQYGYPFYLGKYEQTDFSEAALRRARYGFLDEIRRDMGFDYIVTAHHNNDFLETAIFNTIRGADREGMVALRPKRGKVVRPMLNFSKPEIVVFANLQSLPYLEDSTNSDLAYSRNFVRGVLLPHGSIKFKNFHHNLNRRLSRLGELNKKINIGLSRVAEGVVNHEDSNSIQVDLGKFNSLPESLKPSLLVYLVKRLVPTHSLTKTLVAKVIRFLMDSNSGARLSLPDGLQLINTYDTFVITSKPSEFSLRGDDSLHILRTDRPFSNDLFKLSITTDGKSAVKVPEQRLYVRYRQAGDRVQPVGMSGSKKLQDIFVDAKVPKHLRDYWPVVVTAGNEIVWVPQLVKDRRFFEADADKYQFLRCEVI